MTPECAFYAANGKHCVIGDQCLVCRQTAPATLQKGEEITLVDFGGLEGKYRVVGLFEGTLKLELVK